MSDWPVLALIFTVTAALAFLGLAAFTLFETRDDDTNPEPVPRLFGPFTPLIAGLLPSTASGRLAIQKDLLRAGFFEPVALINFLAVRSLTTYIPLLAGEILAVFTEDPISLYSFIAGILLAILGYAIPRILLSSIADSRTEEIRRGLPMLMDTLGLTLSTGASLPSGLLRSGEAIRRGNPELSREVRVVVAHGEMRGLSYALDRWKDRQPIPELGSFVYLLGQSDRLGTNITPGLWELSASLQVSARQRAEAAANRANFYMIFPTVFCLLVAAGLILIGPNLVRLDDLRSDIKLHIEKAKDTKKLIDKKPLLPGTKPTATPATPATPASPVPLPLEPGQ
jgi:tight adherence protein C